MYLCVSGFIKFTTWVFDRQLFNRFNLNKSTFTAYILADTNQKPRRELHII